MAEAIQIRGLKEVDERLVMLGQVAGERVMRSVLFAASKPIADQAVANLSVIRGGSGALAKATRRVYMRSRSQSGRGTRFVVAIAPKVKDRVAIALANLRYKRRKPIRGVFWGHLVEWGFTHRDGRVAGRMVFTRALNARADEAIETFRKLIGPRVDRALKRQQP